MEQNIAPFEFEDLAYEQNPREGDNDFAVSNHHIFSTPLVPLTPSQASANKCQTSGTPNFNPDSIKKAKYKALSHFESIGQEQFECEYQQIK